MPASSYYKDLKKSILAITGGIFGLAGTNLRLRFCLPYGNHSRWTDILTRLCKMLGSDVRKLRWVFVYQQDCISTKLLQNLTAKHNVHLGQTHCILWHNFISVGCLKSENVKKESNLIAIGKVKKFQEQAGSASSNTSQGPILASKGLNLAQDGSTWVIHGSTWVIN